MSKILFIEILAACTCSFFFLCPDADTKIPLFGRALRSEVKLDPLELLGTKYRVTLTEHGHGASAHLQTFMFKTQFCCRSTTWWTTPTLPGTSTPPWRSPSTKWWARQSPSTSSSTTVSTRRRSSDTGSRGLSRWVELWSDAAVLLHCDSAF